MTFSPCAKPSKKEKKKPTYIKRKSVRKAGRKKPFKITKKYTAKLHKAWEKHLDALWRLAVHTSFDDCCWTPCPSKKPKDEKVFNAHHCFTRKRHSTRWDVDNGFKLCYYCHEVRLKEDAEGFRVVAVQILGGEEVYAQLHQKSLSVFTNTTSDNYEAIEVGLIARLEYNGVSQDRWPKKPKMLISEGTNALL